MTLASKASLPSVKQRQEALRSAIRGKATTVEALGLKAADAKRLARIAAAFIKEGDFESAEVAAELATACDGQELSAWIVLGTARARRKSYLQAVPCYLAALQRKPDDIGAWVALGELYIALSEYAKAAEALRQALVLDPKAMHPAGRRARALIGKTIAMLRK